MKKLLTSLVFATMMNMAVYSEIPSTTDTITSIPDQNSNWVITNQSTDVFFIDDPNVNGGNPYYYPQYLTNSSKDLARTQDRIRNFPDKIIREKNGRKESSEENNNRTLERK